MTDYDFHCVIVDDASTDKIMVLEDGRIVEEGKHEQLLSGRGRYYQLVASGAA